MVSKQSHAEEADYRVVEGEAKGRCSPNAHLQKLPSARPDLPIYGPSY